MRVQMIACAAALAAAACTHSSIPTAPTAQVDGDDEHVVVRAEGGRLWWAHRAWTEPHELWTLPTNGQVQNLTVERSRNGYVVTFDQGGSTWNGSFGNTQIETLARSGR